MKAIVLTPNEKEVLVAIVANARKVGDNGVEFILADVANDINRSIRSVTGTVVNLQKKGLVRCVNGECRFYFDGEVTEEGFKVVEERKEEEFNAPVMDERIVYMNEVLDTKLSSISKSKREDIKAAKAIIKHIFENWDNAEINGGLKTLIDDKEVEVSQYKLWCIAKSRYDQLVAKAAAEIEESEKEEEISESEEELKADTTTSETAIEAPETPKAKKDTSKKSKGSSKRYNVGDHHPQHPDWIYTEYKPGKFDWRADKSVSKVKTDKKAEEVSKPTKENEPKSKKTSDKPKKEEMKVTFDKAMNVDEFIVALRGKNLSATQKSHLKLLKKGYRISGDKRFFELENSERKACNWESIQAMMAKVGITEIPTGLVK